MRNKKGFTLVELLAVMVLLILLILVAYPNFASLSSQSKNKYDNTVCVLIKNAASMYVNNNPDFTQDKVTIDELIKAGYLESDITDSKGVEVERSDSVEVITTVTNGVTEYTYKCPQQLNN